MNNRLLTTLEIIAALGDAPATVAELQAQFGDMSIATLKRHIAEARLLGADIASLKSGKSWNYQLNNKADIRVRLARWIELERTRDLTS